MYAIVDIAGQQFKVQKDSKIYVHRLDGDEGAEVSFDKVLLIENDDNIMVGDPVLEGAVIHAKILSHVKGDKVLVFKKKRRKGFKKLRGHRQFFSQIIIEDIIAAGGVKRAAVTKTKVSAPKSETEVVKEPKKLKKVAEKKEVVKKVAEKKPKAASTEAKKEKAPAKKTTTAKASKETKAPAKAKTKGKSAKE